MFEHSIIPEDKLKVIQSLCLKVREIEGSAAEFGVYKGGSAKIISDILSNKWLHLFDTFTGIPIKGNEDIHNVGDFSDTSLEAVRKLVGDTNTWYHVGPFPAGFKTEEKFCFVHLDCDQYQSMVDGLNFFYPKMSIGGVIVIDDYGWLRCHGVKLAVDNFMCDKPEITKCDVNCQIYFEKE